MCAGDSRKYDSDHRVWPHACMYCYFTSFIEQMTKPLFLALIVTHKRNDRVANTFLVLIYLFLILCC